MVFDSLSSVPQPALNATVLLKQRVLILIPSCPSALFSWAKLNFPAHLYLLSTFFLLGCPKESRSTTYQVVFLDFLASLYLFIFHFYFLSLFKMVINVWKDRKRWCWNLNICRQQASFWKHRNALCTRLGGVMLCLREELAPGLLAN